MDRRNDHTLPPGYTLERQWILDRLETLSVKEQAQLTALHLSTGRLRELSGKDGKELELAVVGMRPEAAVDAITQTLTFYNDPIGGVEIIKVNAADTKERIANVTFEIRKVDDELIDTVTTDKNGRVFVSLEDGAYYAAETEAAEGFRLDDTPHYFEVENGKTTTLRVENEAFSGILIKKIDSSTRDGIYGVTFLLYDNNKNPIGQYTSDDRGYPILSNLYDTIEDTYQNYDGERALYPKEMLRDLLLGLHSMCKGADARFFNGHTNISSSRFLVFCVKGLDNVAQNLRDTLLFNILSYMSDQLLTAGNTVAAIDELYLWLSNPTAVTYIRNSLKRVRKKDSALILASQNLEDFDQPGVRELTRPLFAIPTHQFLFNAGSVDKKFYMDNLQLEPSEFELIRYPQRGVCLYKCGNERYLLEVHAPPYKEKLFGTAGGR